MTLEGEGAGTTLIIVVGKDLRSGHMFATFVHARVDQKCARVAVVELLAESASMEIESGGEPPFSHSHEPSNPITQSETTVTNVQLRLTTAPTTNHASQ